jgi:tetratricopeptide (TPR) repeat protein
MTEHPFRPAAHVNGPEYQVPPGPGVLPAPDTHCSAADDTAHPFSEASPPEPPSDEAQRAAPWPTVEGYEILGELGRGSMGVVYRARQKDLNRLVALKMVRMGAHAGHEALTRLIDEARVVARLQHPNIIQIYEISLRQGLPFFSMELVEGGNLAEWLGGKPLPFRQAGHVVLALARAVHAAHQNGIIHRDLKPANILLAPSLNHGSRATEWGPDFWPTSLDFCPWTPKITDFGLAKQLGQGAGQTESGMVMGTPSYMAPEQAEGKSREVGPPADVYSLGAILYELLTGRPPYNAESPMETVMLLFQTEPVAPSRLQPRIPRDLETVCLKCLQKEPHRRYASAHDLAEDLRRFLAGEPITARPAPLAEQAWKWVRRRPALATLLSVGLLALAALLGLAVWHQLDLTTKLGEARASHEAATQRERLADLRDEVKDLLRDGEGALGQQDWRKARLELTRARDKAGDEADLADLRVRIDQLLEQTDRQRSDRERLQGFRSRRNDALFNATLFTGGDLIATLDETRTAAREALALFGVAPGSDTAPTAASPYLQQQEQAEVRAGCYELLLVLAEAVAQPRPGQPDADQRAQAEEAVRILDRAARIGPPTRAYHLRRARYLAQEGDAAAAEQERQKAEAVVPAGALDHFLVGEVEYRKRDWKRAIDAFENVLQEQPEHFWAQYYLALCRLKTRHPDLAASGLTACLALRPGFAWPHLLRGAARGELGQFAGAEADFQAAEKSALDDSARYALWVNRGVLRIRQGRAADAVVDLQNAVGLKPGQYQGYVNLAQAYLKGQQLEDAVRQMDEAIRREAGLAALYRTRARLHLLRQDSAAALADLETTTRLDPAVAEDHVEKAHLLLRRKEYRAAEGACEAALALRPQHAQAHRLRAEALLAQERLPEALQALDASLKYGPADADVFRARAAVRATLGEYGGAQTDYTRALELHPDAATYAGRGWTYLATKAAGLALPDFEKAVALEPDRGEAYNGRGFARALLGQSRPAVADADEALRLGPRTSRTVYNAARTYAQVAGLPAEGAGGVGSRAWALRAQSEGRALQLLREAVELLPESRRAAFWRSSVQADPALIPIRRTTEFRGLEAQYSR